MWNDNVGDGNGVATYRTHFIGFPIVGSQYIVRRIGYADDDGYDFMTIDRSSRIVEQKLWRGAAGSVDCMWN